MVNNGQYWSETVHSLLSVRLYTKVTKYGMYKLHSFETEMDAHACNVS